MRYGVNQKVDIQLVVGDGTAPNISGTYDTGNYTAHGYANAALGSTLKNWVDPQDHGRSVCGWLSG